MSTFSHTAWTVICNGREGDGRPCGAQGNSDTLDLRDGTASLVRKILKARGWAVNIPNPDRTGPARLDYCPGHKPEATR